MLIVELLVIAAILTAILALFGVDTEKLVGFWIGILFYGGLIALFAFSVAYFIKLLNACGC